jgi:tape measure domain-containing protein
MAESEIYRVEIPIIVDDQSEAPINRTRERVNRFEREAKRRNEMIRKHFESIAKLRIEPILRVRDQLTAGVLKADKLIKRLDAKHASPIIAVQDRVSAVVTRINAILSALDKGKVDVIADMKGPLMDEIVKARAALSALNDVKAGPIAELRGELFGQLAKATSLLRNIDKLRAEPRISLRERVTEGIRKITASLRGLTSKTWTVVLQVKDRATATLRKAVDFITSPLTLLGAGAGLTAALTFPLKIAGEIDRAQRSVILFSGAAEQGRKNFEDLVNLAIKSPIYEVPFVVKEAGQLLAKGMNIDFVKRALNAFGNAAMYTGASLEQLELAFYGFGQIASVGTLSMEELRQVTENLNVPLNWITEELGVSGSKLKELGKLAIPAKRAMEAIVRTLEKRFPIRDFNNDLMALISSIKEAGRTLVWRFGEGMLYHVIRILQDISGFLDPASEKFKQFQQKAESFGRSVGQKFEEIYKRIKQFWQGISADPEFQKLSLADKIIFVIDKALDGIKKWLDGPGGEKLKSIFAKLAEIIAKVWLDTLSKLTQEGFSSLASGNILSGAGFLAGAGMLGGGWLLRGLGKGAIRAGEWIFGGIGAAKGATTAAVAAGVAEAASAATGAGIGAGARALSAIGKTGQVLGRIGIPIAIGAELLNILRATDKKGALITGAGRIGGMLLGGKAGAVLGKKAGIALGSAVGSLFGGVGAVPGGIIGGLLGSVLGWLGGEAIAPKIAEIMKQFDFEQVKTKAVEIWESMKQAASDAWTWIKENFTWEAVAENIGFAVGYIEETLFNGEWWQKQWEDIKTKTAEAWDNMKTVWENVKTAISDTIFSSKWWSEKWESVKGWASEALGSLRETIDNLKAKWESIKEAFKRGQEAGQEAARRNLAAHATGGIFTRPHLALVAEAGPEAIIPLSERMRSRALKLWQATGRQLGVRMYAEGGIVGSVPVAATVPAAMPSATINLNFDLAGLVGQIIVNNQADLDSAIDEITGKIADKLREIYHNTTQKR